MKKRPDRITSQFLPELRKKVLVATFQSLAIRRERGSNFDGKPITDTRELLEHLVDIDLDNGEIWHPHRWHESSRY